MENGIYECISEVKIRREPRIVESPTNQVGLLKVGTQRRVFSVVTQKNNVSWGRVSAPDAAGISQWVCIQGLNRTYMKLIQPDTNNTESSIEYLKRIESKLDQLLAR